MCLSAPESHLMCTQGTESSAGTSCEFCSGEIFPSRCHGKFSLGRLIQPSSLSSLRISRQLLPPLFSCPRSFSQIVLPSTKKPSCVTPVPIPLLSTADKRVLWAGGDFCQEVLPQALPVHCGCWGRPGVGRERQQQMTESICFQQLKK